MDELGSLLRGGFPLALVMFAMTAFTWLRRRRERRRTQDELPALAAELGLSYHPSRYASAQGRLAGTWRTHEVQVDAEDLRRILVRPRLSLPLDFRTDGNESAPPAGWVLVHAAHAPINRFFRTRYAAPPVAAALARSPELDPLLTPFREQYARQIRALSVGRDGLSCRLDFGSPPYIPAAAIRLLLPACVALLSAFEAHAEAAVGDAAPSEGAAQSGLTPPTAQLP